MTGGGLSSIEACLFDAYGTLLDLNSAVAAESRTLGRQADELAALWRRKQLEYTWLRSLLRCHADFAAVTKDALDVSLDTLGLQEPGLRARLLAAYAALTPYPEVAAVLGTLRRHGLRTAVLSNGTPEMLAQAFAAAEIMDLLDEVISVEAVGIFKPAPEVYHHGAMRLRLPATRIAFLSSNGWDVHGAATFGFRTVWVNRGAWVDERLPGAASAVIPSLAPLPELLGCTSAP
jgi:2-haloacid dehalogenase